MEEVQHKQAIRIQQTEASRIGELDFEHIPFGRVFSDHMFEMDYRHGTWQEPVIRPFQRLSLNPSVSAIHYGQSIFEGMKGHKDPEGAPQLFRPEKNIRRFNRSAKRMAMPEVPEGLFMEALRQLVRLDRQWIPADPGSALYIRPFMFATDEYIGIKPSDNYKFIIFTCPVGPYYPKPVKVKVAEKYVRAFPGGTGYAKAAGNYGGSLMPLQGAKKEGYDQLLWMDGIAFKYIQESGTMNVFFVIDGTVVTPGVNDMILDGITRNSIIQLCKDRGLNVEERKVSIDEVVKAYDAGKLEEVFGTGTAVTVAQIELIGYRNRQLQLAPGKNTLAAKLKQDMEAIKTSRKADRHGWIMKV